MTTTETQPQDPQAPQGIEASSEGGLTRAVVDPSQAAAPSPASAGEGLLAGKYKTPQDLEKAYKELEARLGAPRTETPAETPEVPPQDALKTPQITPPAPSTEAAEQAVEKAGLDMAALNTEYATSGKLSDETYTKLAQAGITKDLADGYIEGQKARAEKYGNTLAEAVGGRETLDAMFQWAGANLEADEITAINSTLQSMNEASAKLVLQGLQARFTESVGKTPQFVNGTAAPARGGLQPFSSPNAMADAMADKRYGVDPEYTQEVYRRADLSNFTR